MHGIESNPSSLVPRSGHLTIIICHFFSLLEYGLLEKSLEPRVSRSRTTISPAVLLGRVTGMFSLYNTLFNIKSHTFIPTVPLPWALTVAKAKSSETNLRERWARHPGWGSQKAKLRG